MKQQMVFELNRHEVSEILANHLTSQEGLGKSVVNYQTTMDFKNGRLENVVVTLYLEKEQEHVE